MGNLIKANQKEAACKKLTAVLKELRKKLSLHEVQEIMYMVGWWLYAEENEAKKSRGNKK